MEVQNRSIFKISEEYINLMNQIEEAEGEITPEMSEALVINESDISKKSMSYLGLIKTKEAREIIIDNEIKRLTALKKRDASLVSKLKENLLNAIHLFGGDKKELTVGLVTFATRKSTSVVAEHIDDLDKQYIKKKVTESIDRKKIGDDLKAGKQVEGAYLSTNYSLRIK